MSNFEDGQQALEDSVTVGYDTVMAIKGPSHSAKPLEYEDINELGKKAKSPGPINPTGIDSSKVVGNNVKVSTHPRGRMFYEDVEDTVGNAGVSPHSSNRIGSEDIDDPLHSPYKNSQSTGSAGRFQIKVTTPQQDRTGENEITTKTVLPEYSVVVKPKKKMHVGEDKAVANSTAPMYSVVYKPKKKKKELAGINAVEISSAAQIDGPSHNLPISRHEDITAEDGCESVPSYAEASSKASAAKCNDDEDNAPYKNLPNSNHLQQPLYSNCREIEEMNDSDMGDISSREPAPPPIPIRSYSAGWSDMNAVTMNGGDHNAQKKSISPEVIGLNRMDPVDSFV